jgi:mRNA interferase HigB
MTELLAMYRDADQVRGYVIFNVRHNRYRLVTVVHFSKEKQGKQTLGHIYIRSFLTHKEYDNPSNWDKEFGS